MQSVITSSWVVIWDALKNSGGTSNSFYTFLDEKVKFLFSFLGTLLVTMFNFVVDIATNNMELLIWVIVIGWVYYKVTGKIPFIGHIRPKRI